MPAANNYVGARFGKLTVVRDTLERKHGKIIWECKCDCGNSINVMSALLINGSTRSCGCLRKELLSIRTRRDIAGMRFGRLTAIRDANIPNHDNHRIWECVCDCGKTTYVPAKHLLNGNTKSCGCLKDDVHRERLTKFYTEDEKHLGHILDGIKSRCINTNNHSYRNYWARGIYVCDEWRNDSLAFVKWALSSGYAPGLTIDRIDVNGPYAPWNCRWVTYLEQANNKTNNHTLTVDGVTKTAAQWAHALGVTPQNIANIANSRGDDAAIRHIRSCL